ncbi:MAG: aldehyde dehydrogenase family protein, partial [Terriglobales bacterium]
MADPKTYKNFIAGKWAEARTGKTYQNLNPADTRDVVGIFQRSSKEDVDAAVAAAKTAFETWRLVPAPRRAEILYRAGQLL